MSMMVLFQGTGRTVTREGLASNQLTALGCRLSSAGPRSAKILGPRANPGPRSLLCQMLPLPLAAALRGGLGMGWALPFRASSERASRRQIPQRVTFCVYLLQPLLFMIPT